VLSLCIVLSMELEAMRWLTHSLTRRLASTSCWVQFRVRSNVWHHSLPMPASSAFCAAEVELLLLPLLPEVLLGRVLLLAPLLLVVDAPAPAAAAPPSWMYFLYCQAILSPWSPDSPAAAPCWLLVVGESVVVLDVLVASAGRNA
jgi:hypothetical protein